MKYIWDNDLHIHSKISACSNDPEQTNERILRYGLDHGLKTICLTDHYWDQDIEGASRWHKPQNYQHIIKAKPLPQAEGVSFLFGCETELSHDLRIAIPEDKFDLFDFIIIATTHYHMVNHTIAEEDVMDAQSRANAWVKRLDAVLNMDLPFYKVGIPHLACALISSSREEYVEILKHLPEDEMMRLFQKAAQLGVGIEINYDDMRFSDQEEELVLRPFRIAKKCGCKFYFGCDAHHPAVFDSAKEIFEKAIDLLELTEDDKFILKNHKAV